MSTFNTVQNIHSLAAVAAREARRDPVLAFFTFRFETRLLGVIEFARIEERIEERLALMASTAKGMTRFGVGEEPRNRRW